MCTPWQGHIYSTVAGSPLLAVGVESGCSSLGVPHAGPAWRPSLETRGPRKQADESCPRCTVTPRGKTMQPIKVPRARGPEEAQGWGTHL